MAIQIIKHAFSMIFGNLGQALRVSVGPYLLLIVVVGLSFGALGATNMLTGEIQPSDIESISMLTVPLVIFMTVFSVFVFGWVAVSWHRFILLEEYTGSLPKISDRPIWPYIGRSIVCGLLIVLLAIPLFLIFGGLATMLASNAVTLIIVMIIPLAILTFVWFRIALTLPSVAVGKPITMSQAWGASSGLAQTILGVAFMLMIINGASELIIEQISQAAPIIGLVLNLGIQWLLLMLGISILTTLYGHLIEKRPLIS